MRVASIQEQLHNLHESLVDLSNELLTAEEKIAELEGHVRDIYIEPPTEVEDRWLWARKDTGFVAQVMLTERPPDYVKLEWSKTSFPKT
jgi:hypothetical protein